MSILNSMWIIIAIHTSYGINFEARTKDSLGPHKLRITLFEVLISLKSGYIKYCRELISLIL